MTKYKCSKCSETKELRIETYYSGITVPNQVTVICLKCGYSHILTNKDSSSLEVTPNGGYEYTEKEQLEDLRIKYYALLKEFEILEGYYNKLKDSTMELEVSSCGYFESVIYSSSGWCSCGYSGWCSCGK